MCKTNAQQKKEAEKAAVKERNMKNCNHHKHRQAFSSFGCLKNNLFFAAANVIVCYRL